MLRGRRAPGRAGRHRPRRRRHASPTCSRCWRSRSAAIGWVLGELPRSVVGWERVQTRARRHRRDAVRRPRRSTAAGTGARLDVSRLGYGYADGAAGARRPDVHGRAGPHRRAGRRRPARGKSTLASLLVRLVDPDDGQVLARRHRRARAGPRRAGRARRAGAAAARSCSTTPSAATSRSAPTSPTTRCWAALRPAQADGFVAALPDGPGHQGRRAGHDAVRRPAAAARRWPGRWSGAAAAGPRRRDPRGRPRGRGAHPGRAAHRRRRRLDRARGRLPAGDDRAGRRGRLPRARPGRRQRHPRRAAGRARPATPTWSPPTSRRPSAEVSRDEHACDDGRRDTGDAIVGALRDLPAGARALAGARGAAWPAPSLLALIAMVGRVVVPVAVQQAIDKGLARPAVPTWRFVDRGRGDRRGRRAGDRRRVVPDDCRLFTSESAGWPTLRIRAFRHVHDLSMLHQQTERRGALVSRVTSDVDQISQFLQLGGVISVVSVGQIVVATVVMAIYSLAADARGLRLLRAAVPVAALLPAPARRRRTAWCAQRVGDMLGAVSETVVGAADRPRPTASRPHRGPHRRRHRRATGRQHQGAGPHRGLVLARRRARAGLANAGVLVVGVLLGVDGQLTAGELIAFLFLVTLFVGRCRSPPRCSTRRRTRSPAGAGCSTCSTPRPTSPTRASTGASCRAGRWASGSTDVDVRLPRRPAGAARRRPARSRRAPGSRSSARPARARRRSPSC